MKRLSLAASLLAFGGLSMIAPSAHAIPDGGAVNVPFIASQGSGCILSLAGVIDVVPVAPGEMTLDATQTKLSSLETGGNNGLIGLLCTSSFTAAIDDAQISQEISTGTTEFAAPGLDAGFDGDLTTQSKTGTIGLNVLNVDLEATVADPANDVVAAGDYSFIVPVTITATN